MTRIVLFGVGSSIVVEYAETCARLGYEIAAAVQNRPGEAWLSDRRLIVDAADLPAVLRETPCLCPQFTPSQRSAASSEALALGFAFAPALIDPTAAVARSTVVGAGSFVNAGAIVGAECTIGEHVVVNRGTSIGHHVTIAPFASLGPGVVVAGCVAIGYGASVGAGAVIVPKIRIGEHAIVGAGAVVVRDVPPHTTVFGNPARVVRTATP